MQINIGGKRFEADPYFINEKLRAEGLDDKAKDPYEYDPSGLSGYWRRRSITAIDYRLIQSERRKIYEYNCKSKRGDFFDLDAKGNLIVSPVIYYLVQKKPRYPYSGPNEHPNWKLGYKRASKLADDFRDAIGLPAKVGMTDPNAGVDKALAKWASNTSIIVLRQKMVNPLIPDKSFEVYVDIDFAYYRLKFGDPKKGDHVIIGLPRRVTNLIKITAVCRAEDVKDLKKVGTEKRGKPITIGLPQAEYAEAIELRRKYDKSLAENAEAAAKKKAQSEREKLKEEIERREEDLEWQKKHIKKLKEKLEGK